MEIVREWEKNNSGKRGFSTSSLTKSHHFRRLTSACDKCSTSSSSLPISLELETPEASAACKIKNDHLIHSSTKYISGKRRKRVEREREREGGSAPPVHECTTLLHHSWILLNQSLLTEALIQMNMCIANRFWHCKFSSFSLTLWDYLHCSAFSTTHSAPHMAALLKRCWRCPLQIAAAAKPFKWSS